MSTPFDKTKYHYAMLNFHSWTAICRGAVIHGMTVEKVDSPLSVEVRSRVARKSPHRILPFNLASNN